jgi:hypothetical protein
LKNQIKSYLYLPARFHKRHDYCEFVISQIEDLILNEEFIELKTQVFEFPPEFIKKLDTSDKHFLDLLEEEKYDDIVFHLIKNSVLLSLIMETCYFLQESFLCSLKMRMTVCFTLLRKPFLEILMVLMRILNDEDFIDNFNHTENYDPILTSPGKKKELLNQSNIWLHNKYNYEDLYDFIFNKDFGDSLFNLTNNAIHLYTDRNPISTTEKQNLNFIFSNKENIESQWEYVYDYMPMLVTFIADIIDLLVLKSTNVKEKTFVIRMKARDRLRKKNNVS